MNESEWLATDDVAAMLNYLEPPDDATVGLAKEWRPSLRKLSLFVGQWWPMFTPHRPPHQRRIEEFLARPTSEEAWDMLDDLLFVEPQHHELPRLGPVGAALLREIVGNVFRPLAFDPAWRTPTVVALAQAAYSERTGRECGRCKGRRVSGAVCKTCNDDGRIDDGALDPHRLAVLSDALEEAGCTDADILNHLRGGCPIPWCDGSGWFNGQEHGDKGPFIGRTRITCPHFEVYHGSHKRPALHYRGCWAVDLCLSLD